MRRPSILEYTLLVVITFYCIYTLYFGLVGIEKNRTFTVFEMVEIGSLVLMLGALASRAFLRSRALPAWLVFVGAAGASLLNHALT